MTRRPPIGILDVVGKIQDQKVMHRNRGIYIGCAVTQFAVGVLFIVTGIVRSEALHLTVGVLAVAVGALLVWKVRSVARTVAEHDARSRSATIRAERLSS